MLWFALLRDFHVTRARSNLLGFSSIYSILIYLHMWLNLHSFPPNVSIKGTITGKRVKYLCWNSLGLRGEYQEHCQPFPYPERYRTEHEPLSIWLEEYWPVPTIHFSSATGSWPKVWETLDFTIPTKLIWLQNCKGSDYGKKKSLSFLDFVQFLSFRTGHTLKKWISFVHGCKCGEARMQLFSLEIISDDGLIDWLFLKEIAGPRD
jgi:hypothetical protein